MNLCDTMIHINETLATPAKATLVEKVRSIPGVIAPRFNKAHLLVICYNSTQTQAKVLLETVRQEGYNAKLIGF